MRMAERTPKLVAVALMGLYEENEDEGQITLDARGADQGLPGGVSSIAGSKTSSFLSGLPPGHPLLLQQRRP